jgi:hypothetical protein
MTADATAPAATDESESKVRVPITTRFLPSGVKAITALKGRALKAGADPKLNRSDVVRAVFAAAMGNENVLQKAVRILVHEYQAKQVRQAAPRRRKKKAVAE